VTTANVFGGYVHRKLMSGLVAAPDALLAD
jgi:hypothetical protein